MNRCFIIQVNYGGLGDHLLHSHMPRIAKEKFNYKKVLVSKSSQYRDEEYKRLIWEMNPYVDGFSDEKINFGSVDEIEGGKNILDKVMIKYGLNDQEEWHEPELYFKPPILDEFLGKVIYDPNYISNSWNLDSALIQSYLYENNIKIDYMMNLREKNIPLLYDTKRFETLSLENFCSLIVSCDKLFCLVTGTATLAASLKKSANVFYGRKSEQGVIRFLHSQIHNYIPL